MAAGRPESLQAHRLEMTMLPENVVRFSPIMCYPPFPMRVRFVLRGGKVYGSSAGIKCRDGTEGRRSRD